MILLDWVSEFANKNILAHPTDSLGGLFDNKLITKNLHRITTGAARLERHRD
jgi:hypothetical protein